MWAWFLSIRNALTTQRFHGDDSEALVDGVYLNEESLTQITRLFKVGTGTAWYYTGMTVLYVYWVSDQSH